MARELALIRPGGDPSADDLADWAGDLRSRYDADGHIVAADVTLATPCSRSECEQAIAGPSALVLFFGHGLEDALLGSQCEPVVDEGNLPLARGKTIVSVACETGLRFGSDAIRAGVRAHIGWNVMLLWLERPSARAPYRDAIIGACRLFGQGASVSEVADALKLRLDKVAAEYRPTIHNDRNLKLAYYATMAAAGQIAVDGDRHVRPLSTSVVGDALGWVRWRASSVARTIAESFKEKSP